MKLSPPMAMKLLDLNTSQVRAARAGICPMLECRRKTLACAYVSEGIKFYQCSKCLVVVALA